MSRRGDPRAVLSVADLSGACDVLRLSFRKEQQ